TRLSSSGQAAASLRGVQLNRPQEVTVHVRTEYQGRRPRPACDWRRRAGDRAESGPAPVAAAAAQAAEPAVPSSRPVVSYADAVARVAPAVVTIRVELKAEPEPTGMPDTLRRFFGPQTSPENMPHERGLGSGVIVSPDGRILTNA